MPAIARLGALAWLCIATPVAAAPPVPGPGDVFDGAYEIERKIGEGSGSIVYAARDLQGGGHVAIKWSKLPVSDGPKLSQRLEREYRAARKVEHPGIVHMQRLGHHMGHVYLAMELLEGEPLSNVIERGPMEVAPAVDLVLEAMEAVAACHAHGVIHRDIKPGNIFVLAADAPGDARVKVIDFSLSKLQPDPGQIDLELTQQGQVLGTPLYMAPEQIRHAGQVDVRADVYAFGVVLYRMLTQDYPLKGDSYQDFLVRLATAAPMPIQVRRKDLPKGLSVAVMRAIEHDRTRRFPDLAAFASALRPYSSTAPSPEGGRGYGTHALVAVCLLVLGAAVALWRARRRRRGA